MHWLHVLDLCLALLVAVGRGVLQRPAGQLLLLQLLLPLLLGRLLVLEEERKVLQGATRGLGPQPVDETGLDDDPACVDQQELPTDFLQACYVLAGRTEREQT